MAVHRLRLAFPEEGREGLPPASPCMRRRAQTCSAAFNTFPISVRMTLISDGMPSSNVCQEKYLVSSGNTLTTYV
eukprot:6186000-Pleurochrysis_carterae.AAC.1